MRIGQIMDDRGADGIVCKLYCCRIYVGRVEISKIVTESTFYQPVSVVVGGQLTHPWPALRIYQIQT